MFENLHSRKRPAESDPEGGNQPLAKRLGRLHIDSGLRATSEKCGDSPSTHQPDSLQIADAMILDDPEYSTAHNLNDEIRNSNPPGYSISFLPSVVADLTSVPKILTMDLRPRCNDLVLYQDPKSLTVPQERDYVRKAILETRQRVRSEQSNRPHLPKSLIKISDDTVLNKKSAGIWHADDFMEVEEIPW